jgi:hypothetical protein
MIFAKMATLLVLSQYTRSRVDGPNSQCLWWAEQTQISFHQNEKGNPETPGETEFGAIKKAYDSWQTQMNTCGNLAISEGQRTNSRDVGYIENKDNMNVVLFRQKNCSDVAPKTDKCWTDDNCGNAFDCWQHIPGAIALTTTSFNKESGRILDSDIELNTPNFIFSAVDAPPCIAPNFLVTCVATDIQNTLTHEVGHLLGLSHTDIPGSTMAPRAPGGEISKRDLDSFSKQFVCDVYPKGKPSRTCKIVNAKAELGKVGGCNSLPISLCACVVLFFSRRRKK